MSSFDSPRILFVPVSSATGMGEYARSMILADNIRQMHPNADVHFILNKHLSYVQSCPYTVHLSDQSPTKDTRTVNQVIERLKPDLVIFDCSGRASQFSAAKSVGAKVIFISQHKRKRARGLKLNRLLRTDAHWVIQPDYAITPLNGWQKLKLALFNKPAPTNIGPILPTISEHTESQILKQFGLSNKPFFIFSAGSGGHKIGQRLAADVLFDAAKSFSQNNQITSVVVFGDNYPHDLPVDSTIIGIKHLDNDAFVALLKAASGRVVSAGDTLLQVIELKLPSVALAVSKDQPARLAACASQGAILSALNTEESVSENARQLMDPKVVASLVNAMKQLQPTSGLNQALLDINELLTSSAKSTKV